MKFSQVSFIIYIYIYVGLKRLQKPKVYFAFQWTVKDMYL